jgi:hypothetical protein
MISSKVYAALAGCALAVAALPGCFFSSETGPGPGPGPGRGPGPTTQTGTLTVAWTVAGSHSAPACSEFGAAEIELVVRDRLRRPITTVDAPCSDFTVQVRLPEGNYEAEATLVDPRSRAVSTMLRLQDIRILAGTDLTIDIDFPGTSRR